MSKKTSALALATGQSFWPAVSAWLRSARRPADGRHRQMRDRGGSRPRRTEPPAAKAGKNSSTCAKRRPGRPQPQHKPRARGRQTRGGRRPAPTPTAATTPAATTPAPAPAAVAAVANPDAAATCSCGQKPETGRNLRAVRCTEADAKAKCGSDDVVWLNTATKVFHLAGHGGYGKSKKGAYMCQADATAAGAHAAKNEKSKKQL